LTAKTSETKIGTESVHLSNKNSKEDLNVKLNKDSDGNVVSVTFGSRDHKIKSIPDKQKLKQAFIGKGMSEESAEKKARKVTDTTLPSESLLSFTFKSSLEFLLER
jgi:hypothetical protein